MNIRPLHDKIVVRRLEAEDKSPGGIVLPDVAKKKPQKGKVLAVGDGRRDDEGTRIAMDVKEGDTVLFTAYAGNDVELDNQKLLILREEDVLAIVR